MSTKRKTLKQKKMSDIRKLSSSSESPTPTPTTPVYEFKVKSRLNPSSVSTQSPLHASPALTYSLSDIKHSLIVSFFLLLANGIIFILLKNAIIPLPLFGF